MKILSLNTHSLAEPDCEKKMEQFADVVAEELPDIIGLQEVNQTASKALMDQAGLVGYVACRKADNPVAEDMPKQKTAVRSDNYGARLAELLRRRGVFYFWTWIPIKLGYGKYDEGLAIFSRTPILDTHQVFISRGQDYENWKTRKLLGILTQAGGRDPAWFYTVHMGWWDDGEEPFQTQWDYVQEHVKERMAAGEGSRLLWLMGDFNSQDDVRGQGYDYVSSYGWKDTYRLADRKDAGFTVEAVIDGWKERSRKAAEDGSDEAARKAPGMRIDYIWCSRPVPIESSQVICDGRSTPKVSDHSGVMITTKPQCGL